MEGIEFKAAIKILLYFWQEIVFILAISSLILGMSINIAVAFQQTFNVVFFFIFVSLLVCLFGQFYWKNLTLGIVLSVMFSLAAAYMSLAALSDLWKLPSDNTKAIIGTMFGVFLFISLTITAISMPFKYRVGSKFMMKFTKQ